MAGFALSAKQAGVRINIGMARSTGRGRAVKDLVLMAQGAGHSRVFTRQLEAGVLVIERGRRPAIGGVTLRALRAESAAMRIILCVAGGAVHWRALELSIDVTGCAIHCRVPAGQLEGGIIVIEYGRLPAAGRVAGRAVRAKLAIVRVILEMAGDAVHWRAFELSVDVTILTGHRGMFAVQFECELGMIHLCQAPAFGGMTGGAVGSKLTVVMVVFQVAGDAGLGCGLQIGGSARVDVTLRTGQRRMFAGQFERNHIVIKVRTKRLNAIMTGHAVRAEGQEVFGGKCLVDSEVAVAAGVLVERRSVPLDMAVLTGESAAVRFGLVRRQLE